MFHVTKNKYSHEHSGFSTVHSIHETLPEAIAEGESVWASGYQRFVHVESGDQRQVYFWNGRYYPNGEGRIGYSTIPNVAERPAHFDLPKAVK